MFSFGSLWPLKFPELSSDSCKGFFGQNPSDTLYLLLTHLCRFSYSATHAMLHTIHTALVSIGSQMVTGSAWNVSIKVHTKQLLLSRRLDPFPYQAG